MRRRDTIVSIYMREYPRLLLTTSGLIERVRQDKSLCVTVLALFGSAAQLTAAQAATRICSHSSAMLRRGRDWTRMPWR
jgi:hypothetical protein